MVDGEWLSISHQPSAILNPIRFRSSQTRPQQRHAGGADDQAQPVDPPRFEASAQLEPRGGRDERRTDDDRPSTPADEPQDQTANAADRRVTYHNSPDPLCPPI